MLFLTVYFGFINLRSFKLAGRILKGQYRDDNAPGEVTQFQPYPPPFRARWDWAISQGLPLPSPWVAPVQPFG